MPKAKAEQDDFITLAWLRKQGFREPRKLGQSWDNRRFRGKLLPDGRIIAICVKLEDEGYSWSVPVGAIFLANTDGTIQFLYQPHGFGHAHLTVGTRHELLFLVETIKQRIERGVAIA